jgi:hypothetical protein
MTATHAATVCVFAGAGLMLGLVHFLGVRVSTRLYLEEEPTCERSVCISCASP